jgi:uncharacterized protein YegP (UPF0339 family)
MRIELYSRRTLLGGKRWFFRIRAANGEIVAQSEGYHNRSDCRATAQLLRAEAAEAEIFCAEGGKA